MERRWRSHWTALALATLTAGCTAGGSPDASRSPDASSPPDAHGLSDARALPDASRLPDASTLDASRSPDAATATLEFSTCDWQTLQGCSSVPMSCAARGPLPDPGCTPGALNPDVTSATIGATICTSGWTTTVRPPTTYTGPLKLQIMAAYGVGTDTSAFELDHLVPLELGGAPSDPKNLWPEAHAPTPGSFEKDGFENYLKSEVCAGHIALAVAQEEIATDWVTYWLAAGSR